jgi:hypothetical protein
MRRLAVFIPLFAMLAFAAPAQAGTVWCRVDPIVMLNGTVVDISIGIPLEYVPMVNGPVQYEIQTPLLVTRQVILTDVGYGHGAEVVFTDGAGAVKHSSFPVRIDVSIPIDKSQLAPDEVVPVELTVLPANADPVTVNGTSDLTRMRLSIQGQ